MKYIKDCLITVMALVGAFALSLVLQYQFDVQDHVPTVFVFAVFLASLLTAPPSQEVNADFEAVKRGEE